MAAKPAAARDMPAEIVFLTRALKAPTLRDAVPRLADRASAESWTHEEFLAACLQREVSARESHGWEGRIRAARFPARKALEDFDYDHQRSLRRETIAHLGTLPAASLDAVAEHLEACGRCDAAVRKLDDSADPVLAALRRPVPPPPPDEGPEELPDLPGYEVLGPLGRGGSGRCPEFGDDLLNPMQSGLLAGHAERSPPAHAQVSHVIPLF